MSEYNIQMNKYNASNAGYDQLYPQPMKHANTHAKDGNDPITPSMIGTYNKTEIDTALQNKVGKDAPLPDGNDANNAIENGWYGISSTANIPIQYIQYGVMRVDKWYSGCIFQTAYELGEATVLQRRYLENLGWQPWELVNPPMKLGEEYRTTERFNGKPVYAKAVNVSVLPSAGSFVSPSHNIANFGYCVECCGSLVNGTSIPYVNINREGQILLGVNSDNIRIYSDIDISALTAVVKIKYTKTTD